MLKIKVSRRCINSFKVPHVTLLMCDGGVFKSIQLLSKNRCRRPMSNVFIYQGGWVKSPQTFLKINAPGEFPFSNALHRQVVVARNATTLLASNSYINIDSNTKMESTKNIHRELCFHLQKFCYSKRQQKN